MVAEVCLDPILVTSLEEAKKRSQEKTSSILSKELAKSAANAFAQLSDNVPLTLLINASKIKTKRHLLTAIRPWNVDEETAQESIAKWLDFLKSLGSVDNIEARAKRSQITEMLTAVLLFRTTVGALRETQSPKDIMYVQNTTKPRKIHGVTEARATFLFLMSHPLPPRRGNVLGK